MIRGTTPTIEISIAGINIDDSDDVEVTLQQHLYKLSKYRNDLTILTQDEKTIIRVMLSQEETFNLEAFETCELQVRIKQGGNVRASESITINVEESLSEVVL